MSSDLNTPDLILASASPRRSQLLREMGLTFQIVPSLAEEVETGASPEKVAGDNARRKAEAVAGRHPHQLVMGADTVVALGTELFAKPVDFADAARMLGRLQGRMHEVFTGVCLVHREYDMHVSFMERSRVWMKPLDQQAIETYLRRIEPMDKAGAYAAQDYGETIIERIEGSFHNVMGLPTERLAATLQKLGIVRGS